MKDKIEEIVSKKLAYCPEVKESDIYRVHRFRVEELKAELSTLIQEERNNAVLEYAFRPLNMTEAVALSTLKDEETRRTIEHIKRDAVEGFVREFNNKCLHDSINDSYNYPLEEVPNVVYNFMDTYLSSIGKDGE